MALNIKTAADLIVVSKNKQTGNPPEQNAQTLDKAFVFNESSGINFSDNRVNNQGDKTGEVEPTDVTIQDRSTEGNLTQDQASPDCVAWAAAMAFNNHAVTDVGSGVKRHRSQLVAYGQTPAYFTAAHRRGGGSGNGSADFQRHIGVGINTMKLTMQKNNFTQLALGILGIGHADDNIFTEIIVGDDNDTTLTLTNDPFGNDYTNVTVWADLDADGIYEKEVFPTAYNGGTNVLTITSIGGAGTACNYRVTYQATATGGFAWADLAAVTPATEFALKAANMQIRLNAHKTGSDPLGIGTTGQIALCEVTELTWELNWNAEAGRCWRIGSVESSEATQVSLGTPLQTVTVSREVRDYLLKQNFDQNTSMGLYVDALGPAIPGGGGPVYKVALYIPKMKMLTKDFQATDGKWTEAGNFQVLKQSGQPTIEIEVTNQATGYLA